MNCRHCKATLNNIFLDLGESPPSNAYLSKSDLNKLEKKYPLRVLVCDKCWLVQTEDFVDADEMFSNEYAYFSSISKSWVEHARVYVEEAIDRFAPNHSSTVLEIASNDGYLLQFVKEKNITCYGVEPTRSTAEEARKKGIETIVKFFGVGLAEALKAEGRQADLIIANNVLAHVPDINDFVSGVAILLKQDGVASFEFPHLLTLVQNNQFDTVYHEHYSYLSLISVQEIFKTNGLDIFDVKEIPTHGGSLRVFAQRENTKSFDTEESVRKILDKEKNAGMSNIKFYIGFQHKANKVRDDFLSFLKKAKAANKKVIGYGAAAKGNTLLNYSGIGTDLIPLVVDKNPAKQGMYLPGSKIPIAHTDKLNYTHDYVVVLPWNIKDEIATQLQSLGEGQYKLVTAVPKLEIE